MCRVLQVQPSGFYAAMKREPSARRREDQRLADRIEAHFHNSHKLYGSPRIHQDLQADGESCGRKRVARLMRERQLAARVPKKWVQTTDSKHSFRCQCQ